MVVDSQIATAIVAGYGRDVLCRSYVEQHSNKKNEIE